MSKYSTLTIRLEPGLRKLLDDVCRQSGRTQREVIQEALRRQLSILRFEQLRREIMPFAEARGYLTDEVVFKNIS
jgi:predicted transcriptional regulator